MITVSQLFEEDFTPAWMYQSYLAESIGSAWICTLLQWARSWNQLAEEREFKERIDAQWRQMAYAKAKKIAAAHPPKRNAMIG